MMMYETRTTSFLIQYDSLEVGFPVRMWLRSLRLPASLQSQSTPARIPEGTQAAYPADGGLKRGLCNMLAGHRKSPGDFELALA